MILKENIDNLKQNVKERLSVKRYTHTIGVAEMAVRLGEFFIPELSDELYAAALLHDIAKEITSEELYSLLKEHPGYLTEDDLKSADVIHSLVGPLIIKRDFPLFATKHILTAVYNHTLGDENMDIFSEIIFISDFIELGRTYKACKEIREFLISGLSSSASTEANAKMLKKAIFEVLDFTVKYVNDNKGFVHPKSVLARDFYKSII